MYCTLSKNLVQVQVQVLFYSSIIQECKDENSAAYSLKQFNIIFRDFLVDTNQFGCLPPCRITNFKIDLKFYHENSWYLYEELSDTKPFFGLFYFYDTLRVEEKIETLIFDLGGVLAAAGGNLGLCLGFSCLSILHSMICFISQLVKKLILQLLNKQHKYFLMAALKNLTEGFMFSCKTINRKVKPKQYAITKMS